MYKYVLMLIMFILVIHVFVSNVHASSEFEAQSNNWSVLANKVLTFVQQKEYSQALGALKQLEDQVASSNLAEKNLTVDSLHQLLSTILNAKGNLSRLKPNDKEISEAVTKLVLAFDAVSHSKEPQWKSYYTLMLDKTNNIEAAVKKGNKQSVLQQLNQLNNEYQLLRPALIIAKSPSTVNHFDSLIGFMRKKATLQEIGSNLGELRELIKNIFQGTEKDVLAMFHPLKHLPIVIPSFWIIGFIVAILGIVSWRKQASFIQM